eukprot:CAMPEP_0197865430 /NCGR_PEP_ID=MMETSP1438-20131217/43662_1 /TAXON_ID=1461541 /ORGANISM="Pterosperma sp., Strain CCMP1384" /LENGTH=92 /DNA_ID=CAMNT_0043483899 /DNA_START=327 /DNA_END=605 /DNA_ORIENTATION=-
MGARSFAGFRFIHVHSPPRGDPYGGFPGYGGGYGGDHPWVLVPSQGLDLSMCTRLLVVIRMVSTVTSTVFLDTLRDGEVWHRVRTFEHKMGA